MFQNLQNLNFAKFENYAQNSADLCIFSIFLILGGGVKEIRFFLALRNLQNDTVAKVLQKSAKFSCEKMAVLWISKKS